MSPTTLLSTLATTLAVLASSSGLASASSLHDRRAQPPPAPRAASYAGKMTWIGDTTGALTSCGQPYEADSLYVAVAPALNTCPLAGGAGTPITITCGDGGETVAAMAVDKCMGCGDDHIDVATAVWEACGYTTDDGGMHDQGISWSF